MKSAKRIYRSDHLVAIMEWSPSGRDFYQYGHVYAELKPVDFEGIVLVSEHYYDWFVAKDFDQAVEELRRDYPTCYWVRDKYAKEV